jgi:hypothetical protein
MKPEEYIETCFRTSNFLISYSEMHGYYHILNRSPQVALDRIDIETEAELRELLELIQYVLYPEKR